MNQEQTEQAGQTGQGLAANLTPDEYNLLKQSMTQDQLRALQEGGGNTTKAIQQDAMRPNYPNWPTSKRGPMATQPPQGQRPINAIRAEQVTEVGYNQVTGEPATQDASRSLPTASQGPVSPDLEVTGETPQKRKKIRIE